MKYIFRRLDNDELIEVDFETAMSQVNGYITLPDGTEARRCVYLEKQAERAAKQKKLRHEIVSDTLGVTKHQLEESRKRAAAQGLRVDFTPDPTEPTFYQARFPSAKDYKRYADSFGFTDKNSRNGGGSPLSAELLKRSIQRVLSN